MQESKKPHIQELVANKKANFQFELIEKLEVGVVLKGTEIKSLRSGGANLTDAYVIIEKGEMWLVGSSIAPYSFGSHYNHEEKRKRKLMAHRKEIQRFDAAMREKGYTCVPVSLYLKDGKAKLLIALARGKKLTDKREVIKEREDKRSMQRAMKNKL